MADKTFQISEADLRKLHELVFTLVRTIMPEDGECKLEGREAWPIPHLITLLNHIDPQFSYDWLGSDEAKRLFGHD
jgi:hypothetical protein